MFQSARFTLTAWYLVFIMLVSMTFSFAIYRESTFELERIIVRVKLLQTHSVQLIVPQNAPFETSSPTVVLDELEGVKTRLQIALVTINGIIFILAGGAGYFLAGRTLRPIQDMVDEQNQFISDASHELRTPIATLRAEMEASLLEQHLSDKTARKLIASNLEELGKLQELANNLLQLAGIKNNGNLVVSVALHDVIHSAYKKVEPFAKRKQVVFVLSPIRGEVKGDRQSLIEVFVNLFDNAIKYSHVKSKVTVSSKLKKHSLVISVEDKGMGIAQSELPHIFDRFYRADKSRSKADGHGLGLSIVKKILEAHNAIIEVESMQRKSSTFTLTFPLAS